MRIVRKAVMYPKKCAVSGRSDGELLDLYATIPASGRDSQLYLRRPVVEKAAGKFGMVTADEHQAVLDRYAALQERVRELDAEMDKFRNLDSAIKAFS